MTKASPKGPRQIRNECLGAGTRTISLHDDMRGETHCPLCGKVIKLRPRSMNSSKPRTEVNVPRHSRLESKPKSK